MLNNHQNPGTVNPADHSFPSAAALPVAASAPASASVKSSSGELQLPALRTSVAAKVAGKGLTQEVHAGSASQVRQIPVDVAPTSPPAKDYDGGRRRPGGLPVNVYIR